MNADTQPAPMHTPETICRCGSAKDVRMVQGRFCHHYETVPFLLCASCREGLGKRWRFAQPAKRKDGKLFNTGKMKWVCV